MSYHSPWRWTDGQLEGFKEGMADASVEYQVFQMDTKRNSTADAKDKKGQEARALIKSWQPDLVYTTDDDAQEYVTTHYVRNMSPLTMSIGHCPLYSAGSTRTRRTIISLAAKILRVF